MTPRTMRRGYLREAAVMLVLARLAVRCVSPARIFAWADRPPRRIRRFATDDIGWVSWAVENLGGKPWMNALCLPRALAAHAMLRRRGIKSRLCLGVARERGAAGTLSAHAWVEIGDDKIVGGAEADGCTRLATFGGASP
jgi:Transglutaminase-like superfamily